MPDEFLNSFRLSLMQKFLPAGIAIIDRVRQEGFREVVRSVKDSDDFINEMRVEGEPAAKSFREQLDQISPGLGNPVKQVNVSIDEIVDTKETVFNQNLLMPILERIEERLDLLDSYLTNDSKDI